MTKKRSKKDWLFISLFLISIVVITSGWIVCRPQIAVEPGLGDFEVVDKVIEGKDYIFNIQDTNEILNSEEFLEKIKASCVYDQKLIKTWSYSPENISLSIQPLSGRYRPGVHYNFIYPRYKIQWFSFKDFSFHYRNPLPDDKEDLRDEIIKRHKRIDDFIISLAIDELNIDPKEALESFMLDEYEAILKDIKNYRNPGRYQLEDCFNELRRLIEKYPDTEGARKMQELLKKHAAKD
ncbi:hypothetical protein ACFL54_00115 [Planctomycetota bacterium]